MTKIVTDKDLQAIRDYVKQGLSTRAISEKLGFSHQTIGLHIRKNGIQKGDRPLVSKTTNALVSRFEGQKIGVVQVGKCINMDKVFTPSQAVYEVTCHGKTKLGDKVFHCGNKITLTYRTLRKKKRVKPLSCGCQQSPHAVL